MGDIRPFPSALPSERDFTTLDRLPFGAILVDEQGKILFYNRREEESAGVSREEFIGQNFFEIAPCTQVKEFHGQFLKTVGEPGFIASLRFRFTFREKLRVVDIAMASFVYRNELLCLLTIGDVSED
jgi:photoactive yellow protein